MANLLPPQELKRVRNYFIGRFLGTGSLVAIVCGISAFLALLPVYAMVRGATPMQDAPPTAAQPLSENEDREALARTRLILRDLGAVASTTSALTILEEVFSIRPKGTTITNVSLVRGREGMIVLGGESPSRDAINAFRDALEKDPRFKTVAVPIGVLAGTAGSHFTITITGTF